MNPLKQWWHRRRHTTCKVCGTEFRKARPTMPSLVGFAYCSTTCEAKRWADWIRGGR